MSVTSRTGLGTGFRTGFRARFRARLRTGLGTGLMNGLGRMLRMRRRQREITPSVAFRAFLGKAEPIAADASAAVATGTLQPVPVMMRRLREKRSGGGCQKRGGGYADKMPSIHGISPV